MMNALAPALLYMANAILLAPIHLPIHPYTHALVQDDDDDSMRLHTITGVDLDMGLVYADENTFHSWDLHYVLRRKVEDAISTSS